MSKIQPITRNNGNDVWLPDWDPMIEKINADHRQALAKKELMANEQALRLVKMLRQLGNGHISDDAATLCFNSADFLERKRHRIVDLESENKRLRAEFVCTKDSEHTGERCRRCGRAYDTVWAGDDDAWEKVVGDGGGLLCPMCFDLMCRQKNIYLHWHAYAADTENLYQRIIGLESELHSSEARFNMARTERDTAMAKLKQAHEACSDMGGKLVKYRAAAKAFKAFERWYNLHDLHMDRLSKEEYMHGVSLRCSASTLLNNALNLDRKPLAEEKKEG